VRQRGFSQLVACFVVLSAALVPASRLTAQFNDGQLFEGTTGSVFTATHWSIDGGCSGAIISSDGKHGDNGSHCLRSLWPVGIGTRMVRDLNPGPAGSTVTEMTWSGIDEVNRVWALADDGSGTAGRELYRIQGALYPVTRLEMDVMPGATGSNPANLFRQDPGGLTDAYFIADDGTHGREPWLCRTEPSLVANTAILADINPGTGSSDASGFAVFGNGDIKGDRAKQDEVIRRLKKIAPQAEKAGVVLGIESWLNADDHLRILDGVGSPAIQVYYDVCNMTDQGYDICQEIRQLGKNRICQIHIKENGSLIGQGKVNLRPVRDAIADIGYRGWLVIEGATIRGKTLVECYQHNQKHLRTLFGAG